VHTADPGSSYAETLGLWIHFADAITLSAVHNDSIAIPTNGSSKARDAAHAAVDAECKRIQRMLANTVRESCLPDSGKTHITLPPPISEPVPDLSKAYAPYRRFYEAHQRDMESSIQPLRARVRETVAKTSPRLKKLADLDATFEKILRDRENKLLSKVPLLLKKRFAQLFQEYQQTSIDARQAGNPAGRMPAGAWLARFCDDMRTLLLAEVELRMQPTVGLIEAIKQDTQ